MTNLGQINHLQWEGVYSNDLKKVGRWRPIWKGSALSDFGGLYSENGKKFGQWKELFKTFSEQYSVFSLLKLKYMKLENTLKIQKQEIGNLSMKKINVIKIQNLSGGGLYDDQGLNIAFGQIQAIIFGTIIKSFTKGSIEKVKKLVYGQTLRMEIMKNVKLCMNLQNYYPFIVMEVFIMNKGRKMENGKI
ncbi:unnamed protein product [Paramecium sonneborni]|uniref:Uncharacterized protein n=1 Tax=Paramecium sonneborni TaxID=65129 RepID=A0A8S1RN89_9CILI|nr:unnamed protein product [Paramecium sonneborni]